MDVDDAWDSLPLPEGAASPPADALPRARNRWAISARSLTSLGLTGAGLGLGLASAMLWPRALESFLRWNALSPPERSALARGLGLGALIAILPAAVYLGRVRDASGQARLANVARALLPFCLLALVPALLVYDFAANEPLTYLVALGAVVVATEWTVRRALIATRMPLVLAPSALVRWVRVRLPALLVIIGATFYAVSFSYYTLLNHRRLGTTAFDLGIHVNWSFNALHGQLWRCPVLFGAEGGHFIGNHAIFAMFTWLPIYALRPGAEPLLIWQSCIVGAAAIPLYLFAKTQIPRWSAAVVALLYLLYAPIHGPNFYDYHELMPTLFWHFWLYFAIATRRNWLVWITVPILCAHREDVAIGIAVLGAFLIVTGVRPKLGTVLAIVSTLWFVTIKFVIMPRLWETWFADIYKDLQAPGGTGFGPVVGTVVINPAYFLRTLLKENKLVYFLHIFAPFAFLPLRRPAFLLLAIPGFIVSLMTTGYAPTMSIAFQYTMHWVPYMVLATVLALRVLGASGGDGIARRRAALTAAVVGMFFHSYAFGAVLQHHTFVGGFGPIQFRMTADERAQYLRLTELVAIIPPDASVAATDNEVPHIAARKNAYTLRYAHGDADYLLINQTSAYAPEILYEVFRRNPYGLLARSKGLFLFKKGHVSPETAAAKKALGIP